MKKIIKKISVPVISLIFLLNMTSRGVAENNSFCGSRICI